MKRLALFSLTCLVTGGAAPVAQNQPAGAPPAAEPARYVSLGDSLTAGYQSAGLRADGQRRAYPVVLAQSLGLSFSPPLGQDPGCPPPLGARVSATSCQRQNPGASVTNFAVPEARVEDLARASARTVPSNARALYQLIVGEEDTQVSAALKARPQLVTLWVGANNVLGAALNGNPGAATTPQAFEQAYGSLLSALRPSGAKLVLLTVPDVTAVPALVPGTQLAAFGLGDASCRGSTSRISITRLFTGSLPLSCTTPEALTASETRSLQGTIAAYNDSIRRLAAREGAEVFEVSTVQLAQDATYDPGSGAPFGPDYSLDGIHPSSAAHERLARALAAFVRSRFGSDLRSAAGTQP
ncbi:SGNH/GDSL hydrolase family protein [Deinococcus peraridilitoris]|uniref:Phospholipase/lecithinase/hemolysin n=1 Tax=Deinococcus peraridilitoris (strain DSM 19664 / LMG 22246 / CIP 109416 / KR-200) TaxID=937777 RepID=K9ZXE7_DEIPD|nr:GDSL-type esterase/lipase family protein [Deinococcus peraridilitoris]AFZ66333.1 phospholipase/lecithinase/hemolysin [Deinococcus peraridilitoris DSM 19664]